MVQIGAIDAVHAWDYTYLSNGADDKKYLEDLERKYDFFRIMRPQDVSMSDFYWFDRNHSLPKALERFGDEKEGKARFSWPPARWDFLPGCMSLVKAQAHLLNQFL